MVQTILMIAAIPCMLAFLFLVLMVMGWIPSERICKFLREHEVVSGIFSALVGIGLIASCIAFWGA